MNLSTLVTHCRNSTGHHCIDPGQKVWSVPKSRARRGYLRECRQQDFYRAPVIRATLPAYLPHPPTPSTTCHCQVLHKGSDPVLHPPPHMRRR